MGTATVAATGLGVVSGGNCIEKIKSLYHERTSKDDYKGPTSK
jgi:hypothetical protein